MPSWTLPRATCGEAVNPATVEYNIVVSRWEYCARNWLDDMRELFGMFPRELANKAFDRLPRGVRARTWSAVAGRATPIGWAVAYAITRGIRNAVWLVAR